MRVAQLLWSIAILAPVQCFRHPRTISSSGGVLETTLRLTASSISVTNDNDILAFSTRTYNGEFPGPTLRVSPGDILRISVFNDLLGSDGETQGSSDQTGSQDPIWCTVVNCTSLMGSTFSSPNMTNLHTHGLHVSPALGSDDVLDVKIPPGANYTYEYKIPNDHMAGTFWYHPHHEGSTALQVTGGAAGMLIIDDEEIPFSTAQHNSKGVPSWLLALPETVLVLQQLAVAEMEGVSIYSNDTLFRIDDSTTVLPTKEADEDDTQKDNNQNFPLSYDEQGNPTSFNESKIDNIALVNGEYQPTLTLVAGQWQRWRVLNAGALYFLDVALHAEGNQEYEAEGKSKVSEAAPVCRMELIAIDGVYLPEFPRAVERLVLTPAGRADVLVKCDTPGQFVMASGVEPGSSGLFNADMYWNPFMATVQVVEDAADDDNDEDNDEADDAAPAHNATSRMFKWARQVARYEARQHGILSRLGSDTRREQSTSRSKRRHFQVPGKLPAVVVQRPRYLKDLRRSQSSPGVGGHDDDNVQHFSFEFEDVALVRDLSPSPSKKSVGEASKNPPMYMHNGDQTGTCTFNNLTFEKGSPLLVMSLDTVQEWVVSGVQAHPLHFHVNPMQIQQLTVDGEPTGQACDSEYGFFCEGDWLDTLQIPNAASTAGAVVRFTPTDFTGDMVIHCHYLIHEDQGCISYALVE